MHNEDYVYLGVNDHDIDLFEGQYQVPHGISYNSWLIRDEKTCLMDTVDVRRKGEFMQNLAAALDGRALDYLVVSHVEPDHVFPDRDFFIPKQLFAFCASSVFP